MKCSESTIKKVSLLCATFIIFLFFQRFYVVTETGHTVGLYIISVALFGISYLLINFLVQKILARKKRSIDIAFSTIALIVIIAFILFSVIWSVKYYQFEATSFTASNTIFLRHTIDSRVYTVLLIVFASIFALFIKQSINKSVIGRCIAAVIIGLGQALFLYTPNFIYDTQGGPFHIDAYVVSIINCLHGAPYSELNMSIYGKYGILYIIPVRIIKLFGFNEWLAVTIAISAIGFLTYIIQGYILSRLIDNDLLYIVSLLALAFPSFQLYAGVYYQVLPHRVLAPTLIIFGCLKYIESKNNKRLIGVLMWILCALAILWNIETGAVSTIVWILTYGYIEIVEFSGKVCKTIIKAILYFCACFACGYLIFNIYNLIVGGHFQNIKRYLYPLCTENSVSLIEKSLDPPWGLYFILVVLFTATVCYYLIQLINHDLNEKQLLIVIISVMGLGCMTYYMNRSVLTNVTIVVFEVVCVCAFIGNGLTHEGVRCRINTLKDRANDILVNAVLYYVCSIIIVAMCLASVFSVVDNYNLVKANGQDGIRIAEYARRMDIIIPQKTLAYGYFVEPLYSYMNRNDVLYIEDWEDIDSWDNVDIDSYITKELNDIQPTYLLTGVRNEVFVPSEYTEIYDSHIEVGSGVEYKLFYKGKVSSEFYLMRNLLIASSVFRDLDSIIVQAEQIDGNDNVLADFWESLKETGIFNEEMTSDEFVIKMFLYSLNRNPSDEEYAFYYKLLEEESYSKEKVLKEFLSNEQYQNDAIGLNYNVMDFYS